MRVAILVGMSGDCAVRMHVDSKLHDKQVTRAIERLTMAARELPLLVRKLR